MKKIFCSAIFLFIFTSCINNNKHIEVLKGWIAYKQKKWDDASIYFLNAQNIETSENSQNINPYICYNIASVFLIKNDILATSEKLKDIDSVEDNHLASSIYYQLGMVAFRQERYDEATLCFRKSLEKECDNIDAKINYELSRKEIKNEAVRKIRSTMLEDKQTEQVYNTLLNILKKRDMEEWSEKNQTKIKDFIYDY